jgi:hypothetical protein
VLQGQYCQSEEWTMKTMTGVVVAIACLWAVTAGAAGLDPAVQAKVDAQIKAIQAWGSHATIVAAVKAQNAAPPADFATMTQEKWASLSVLDPVVRGFSKNPVAAFLKSQKTDVIAEAFVSASDGRKVAFLAKTSGWSHKGKAKHDVPMTG